MGKYKILYKNRLSSFLQYRLNLGLLVISHLITLSGLIFLWTAIYGNGQTVGSYSLPDILLYYILVAVLHMIVSEGVGLGFEVTEEINRGVVTNYLLKPISYTIEQFIKILGKVTINATFMTPVLVLLIVFFGRLIDLPSFVTWIAFVATGCVSLIFYFLIYYISALGSFWLTRGRSAVYGMLIVSNLLNGSMIPLDLFPDWFRRINYFLPFKFLIYIPVQTFLGRISSWTEVLGLAGMWMLLCSGIIFFMWKRGIKKFEAVGR